MSYSFCGKSVGNEMSASEGITQSQMELRLSKEILLIRQRMTIKLVNNRPTPSLAMNTAVTSIWLFLYKMNPNCQKSNSFKPIEPSINYISINLLYDLLKEQCRKILVVDMDGTAIYYCLKLGDKNFVFDEERLYIRPHIFLLLEIAKEKGYSIVFWTAADKEVRAWYYILSIYANILSMPLLYWTV